MTEMRKAIAYHEAGHALIAIWGELEFECVAIASSSDSGQLQPKPFSDEFAEALQKLHYSHGGCGPETRAAISKWIMCALAGGLAVEIAGVGASLAAEGSSADRLAAANLATLICENMIETGTYLKRLTVNTKVILQKHKVKLDAIAEALLSCGTLTQAEVQQRTGVRNNWDDIGCSHLGGQV